MSGAFPGTDWAEKSTQRRRSPGFFRQEISTVGGVKLLPAQGAKQDEKGGWNRLTVMREPVGTENAPVALGMVTSRYEILRNVEAFAFFDPLIDRGWASYEAAGALGDGQTVWAQVRLKDDMKVCAGDSIERYLLLRNHHNGEGAVSI